MANKEAGLYTTVIDIEENWYHEHIDDIPKHILNLIKYAKKRSKQLGTNFELYERLQNLFYRRNQKKSKLMRLFTKE